MKTEKLAAKMDHEIDATSECRQRHQQRLEAFLTQFRTEEEKLIR